MSQFVPCLRSYLNEVISKREGETKFGERVHTAEGENWKEALEKSRARYVLLGTPEDIGVRANYGVGGTYTLWEPALKAVMNVQQSAQLDGSNLLVLGHFDFSDEMVRSGSLGVDSLRELVHEIDDAVTEVVHHIIKCGKIPIVIGGGHNNAYPLLKSACLAKNQAVNCINLDAHSDFRKLEGRHSGNGFRYAHYEGYLKKYAVVGLHENYNAQNIIEDMSNNPDIHFSFYEDIFLRGKTSFYESVTSGIQHVSGAVTGIELDLDCIEYILSSAMTPSGISTLQARQYIHWCAKDLDIAYLHITEGATKLTSGHSDSTTAKLVAYLVTDFLKTVTEHKHFV